MSGNNNSGRKRKPAALARLEGRTSHFKKRPDSIEGIGSPRCPTSLTREQRALWPLLLESMPPGTFSAADVPVLEGFCMQWQAMRHANSEVARVGMMVLGPAGPVPNPYLRIRDRATDRVHALGSSLGLTPAARARLAALPDPYDDPMALLLGDDLDPTAAWTTPAPKARARAN